MIRLILFIIVIFLFVIYSIIDAIVVFIVSKVDENVAKIISMKAIKILFKIFILLAGAKVHIKGKENIDETEALFVISNHRGFFDIIIGYTLLKNRCGFVSKDFFEKIPFLNYWMKKIDCLFLDRKSPRSGMKMVLDAIDKINAGISMWICPEGTRNKNIDPMELLEFKDGAFHVAKKINCKILPIAFVGTEKIFEKQAPFIKPADVYVNIGMPYRISDINENDLHDIGGYNQNLIKSLIGDMLGK